MYEIDFNLFRSLKSCRYAAYSIDAETGEETYGVQGKLQMAATGSPNVQTDEGIYIDGPVLELLLVNPIRLQYITDLNDAGLFEEADRQIINFALEAGVIHFRDEDLNTYRHFRSVRKSFGRKAV